MSLPPPDHPLRRRLADEVHARPPMPLRTPSRASYLAIWVDPAEREAERRQLEALCRNAGIAPPDADTSQFSADLGVLRLKWERHGEFSAYTLVAEGLSSRPFAEPPPTLLPAGWLGGVPGRTLFAAHAKLVGPGLLPDDPQALADSHFGGKLLAGGRIGGGAGEAYADFEIHDDGFSRFVLVDHGFTPRQAGRMMQRLFEIEAYRMMALLALPAARELAPRLTRVEQALAELTAGIGASPDGDDALMQRLTGLAAEVENEQARHGSRFAASRAYAALVERRVAELREERRHGLQTMAEFMARRFVPAVDTCAAVARRLAALSEQVARTGGLLSTRVSITREKQNQALLESMNRRARLQLRLQHTVEGLSVAAIVYYVAGLAGYLAKGLKAGGLKLDPDLVAGLVVPAAAGVVLWIVRRARRQAADH